MAIQHPLSIESVAARKADQNGDKDKEPGTPTKPMSGSRRKAIYRRQGGKEMTPAQERRYAAKVAANGYIPR